MTTVLGLHFGHDGHVAVLQDGRVTGYVLRERITRRKHDFGLDRQCLDIALKQANISVNEIDFCAVTSTQGCDFPLMEMKDFSLSYTACLPDGLPTPLMEHFSGDIAALMRACVPSMLDRVLSVPRDPTTHPVFLEFFRPYQEVPREALKRFPWYEGHVNHPAWRSAGLNFLKSLNASELFADPKIAYGFHLPMKVTLKGHDIPAIRLDHHLAHAASSYYRSPFAEALIITNDGYGGQRTPFSNGGVYIGKGKQLHPVWPHRMWMGHLYHVVGMFLGFDPMGAPGKLMGLAPYGEKIFFDPRWVGNRVDLEQRGLIPTPEAWIEDVCHRASLLGIPIDATYESWIPFNQFQLNLAASTQTVFEEQWLALVQSAKAMMRSSYLTIDSLCLSGGAVLNCPSNSRLLQESGFRQVFAEPNCDDGGLAIGSALWVTFMLLREERKDPLGMKAMDVYAGPTYATNCIIQVLDATTTGVLFEKPEDPVQTAAQDLIANRVVGWYEGQSELGPRALGHRSIIALPTSPTMHTRVNSIKHRENWRPLAPAILESEAENFFEGPQIKSPFMLFTSKVKATKGLAAITHVDGSARVQTVGQDSGMFQLVLQTLFRKTGCPVVLNTSMNGPGEPIVETPDEAVNFFVKSTLDVLYINGIRVTKK